MIKWSPTHAPACVQIITSFYDAYITLRDILSTDTNQSYLTGTFNNNVREYSPHGSSLLRPLYAWRTCTDAGVPDEFCVCQREVEVHVNGTHAPVIDTAARSIVHRINELLQV